MNLIKLNPPNYLYIAFLLMLALYLFFPGARVITYPYHLTGMLFIVLGSLLNVAADRAFKENNTMVKPLLDASFLITGGVFRLSRNPMYLGYVLILLGIAFIMGTASPFIIVLLFALLMDRVFIKHEERRLEAIFAETWFQYRSKIRRCF